MWPYLEKRIFADVMKLRILRRNYSGLSEWTWNLITSVLIKTHTGDTHRKRRRLFFVFGFYWCPLCVVGSNPGCHTALVVMSPWSPLGCDSFPVFPHFSWPWWSCIVLVIYFAEYPPLCVCYFSHDETGLWVLGKNTIEVQCRSSCHKWCIDPHDLSLLMLIT